MTTSIVLRGITWDHTRGFVPLVATAQRFHELYPGIEIVWSKRSLQAFADAPIEHLAEHFDLLIIDHPFVGLASKHELLVPLDVYLPSAFLAEQAAASVGCSYHSYTYDGHQWALAVDAATPVSAHRPDLLAQYDVALPRTWADLLALARRGLVAFPAIAIDSLMHFYMLCIALGAEPFTTNERVVRHDVGLAALELLAELLALCAPACLQRNPIATYEAMTTSDALVYCPFAYGYVPYTRSAYVAQPLRFGGLVQLGDHHLRSTLGGTGLAIARNTAHRDAALAYLQFVASPATQCGLYADTGGQPGHRLAWLNTSVHARSDNFFAATLATLDDAYMRPRYPGATLFQDHAGLVVHRYLRGELLVANALERLDELYRESLCYV